MTNISLSRLELIPATPSLIRMELAAHASLSEALHAAVPLEWPPEEVRHALEFFAQNIEKASHCSGWRIYYWVSQAETEAERILIGSGGFMGAPTAEGVVTLGYGTLQRFRNKGYATEAVQGLTAWALAQPCVKIVGAESIPENLPSMRVLQKSGFEENGPGEEEGTRSFVFRK